jgi:hypothetical protein
MSSNIAGRNSDTVKAVLMCGSLTIWGRTGFDGDTSGSWLHAELDQLVNLIEQTKRE